MSDPKKIGGEKNRKKIETNQLCLRGRKGRKKGGNVNESDSIDAVKKRAKKKYLSDSKENRILLYVTRRGKKNQIQFHRRGKKQA